VFHYFRNSGLIVWPSIFLVLSFPVGHYFVQKSRTSEKEMVIISDEIQPSFKFWIINGLSKNLSNGYPAVRATPMPFEECRFSDMKRLRRGSSNLHNHAGNVRHDTPNGPCIRSLNLTQMFLQILFRFTNGNAWRGWFGCNSDAQGSCRVAYAMCGSWTHGLNSAWRNPSDSQLVVSLRAVSVIIGPRKWTCESVKGYPRCRFGEVRNVIEIEYLMPARSYNFAWEGLILRSTGNARFLFDLLTARG